jgi:hypothetical protein
VGPKHGSGGCLSDKDCRRSTRRRRPNQVESALRFGRAAEQLAERTWRGASKAEARLPV